MINILKILGCHKIFLIVKKEIEQLKTLSLIIKQGGCLYYSCTCKHKTNIHTWCTSIIILVNCQHKCLKIFFFFFLLLGFFWTGNNTYTILYHTKNGFCEWIPKTNYSVCWERHEKEKGPAIIKEKRVDKRRKGNKIKKKKEEEKRQIYIVPKVQQSQRWAWSKSNPDKSRRGSLQGVQGWRLFQRSLSLYSQILTAKNASHLSNMLSGCSQPLLSPLFQILAALCKSIIKEKAKKNNDLYN